ncbi:MAG TPA: acetate--CoA ligase family protein [Sandaracinaceae bacterium LLY-WYZ-13_1]|nr:acetate--CoA ligase family protein [Sandaracinaceae bacterium LLY-WYZ-13_1]
MAIDDLTPFFSPRSVAVVGASSRPESVGHALLKNLLYGEMHGDDRSRGFQGELYAINPKGGEILGQPVHESLTAVGSPVDLVLIAIPPKYVKGVIDEAGGLGTKAVIVISAGFAEMGEEGKALQDECVEVARGHGMRVVGPNCLGVIRPSHQLNASFANAAPPPGHIGLLSQSGALVTGMISIAQREEFGLSAAVSLGAKSDVDDQDILRFFAEDEQTRSIALYVEALRDAERFLEVAREVGQSTPIVAIKGGTTAAGAKAASSHTGSLAGASAAYRAAFAQAGVLQASSLGDFSAWARALAHQPPARGDRVAIVTNAGGPGVLAADACDRHGLALAELSDATMKALDEVLPSVWSRNNPVDVIGDATPERYRDALRILGEAVEVDGVVLIMTVQAMTAPKETAAAIAEAAQGWDKPLIGSFIGLLGTEEGSYLDVHGIPEFNMPERAVSAMGALVRRGQWLRREEAPETELPAHPAPDLDTAKKLVAEAKEAGVENTDLALARRILEAAGVRYNRSGTAEDADGAARVAEDIGFPVVVKLISNDVIHKSDVGGVVLDVVGADGVRAACASIRESVEKNQPGATIDGFTVEEQVKGTEIIVGMSRDPSFGAMMMVGMGGVFVEVYKDVAFRLVPMTRRDAFDMIGEIEAQPLLDGARSRPVLDRAELAELLIRISALVDACPDVRELDLNPLVITDGGLVAIDARVIVG